MCSPVSLWIFVYHVVYVVITDLDPDGTYLHSKGKIEKNTYKKISSDNIQPRDVECKAVYRATEHIT